MHGSTKMIKTSWLLALNLSSDDYVVIQSQTSWLLALDLLSTYWWQKRINDEVQNSYQSFFYGDDGDEVSSTSGASFASAQILYFLPFLLLVSTLSCAHLRGCCEVDDGCDLIEDEDECWAERVKVNTDQRWWSQLRSMDCDWSLSSERVTILEIVDGGELERIEGCEIPAPK